MSLSSHVALAATRGVLPVWHNGGGVARELCGSGLRAAAAALAEEREYAGAGRQAERRARTQIPPNAHSRARARGLDLEMAWQWLIVPVSLASLQRCERAQSTIDQQQQSAEQYLRVRLRRQRNEARGSALLCAALREEGKLQADASCARAHSPAPAHEAFSFSRFVSFRSFPQSTQAFINARRLAVTHTHTGLNAIARAETE